MDKIFSFWKKGKPIAASTLEEKSRLEGRAAIIDEVLKEMGYEKGYENYQDYLKEMMEDFNEKYLPFLDKVDKLAKERKV